jgi:hypothetical protein
LIGNRALRLCTRRNVAENYKVLLCEADFGASPDDWKTVRPFFEIRRSMLSDLELLCCLKNWRKVSGRAF